MNKLAEEYQVDINRVKSTFATIDDDMRPAIACLASIIRFYQGTYSVKQLTEWADIDHKEFISPDGLMQGAIKADFMANVRLYTIEQLMKKCLPSILFFQDQFGKVGYVVCYGMHEGRFIIGEPTFAIMQYFPWQMEEMWIKGITLEFFPNIGFWDAQEKISVRLPFLKRFFGQKG